MAAVLAVPRRRGGIVVGRPRQRELRGPAADHADEALGPLVVGARPARRGRPSSGPGRRRVGGPRPCGGRAGRPTSGTMHHAAAGEPPSRRPRARSSGGQSAALPPGRQPERAGGPAARPPGPPAATSSAAATKCSAGHHHHRHLVVQRDRRATRRGRPGAAPGPWRRCRPGAARLLVGLGDGTRSRARGHRSRQDRAHLSGVAPVTNPSRSPARLRLHGAP